MEVSDLTTRCIPLPKQRKVALKLLNLIFGLPRTMNSLLSMAVIQEKSTLALARTTANPLQIVMTPYHKAKL